MDTHTYSNSLHSSISSTLMMVKWWPKHVGANKWEKKRYTADASVCFCFNNLPTKYIFYVVSSCENHTPYHTQTQNGSNNQSLLPNLLQVLPYLTSINIFKYFLHQAIDNQQQLRLVRMALTSNLRYMYLFHLFIYLFLHWLIPDLF
jgi:hypothetical protein